MINIKKYFYSSFVVYISALLMLCAAWYVSVQLTKYRIQTEAQYKLNNFDKKQTFFTWDFESFNDDIVESFQHYWLKNYSGSKITALKNSNPQLSLNFSGDTLNSLMHSNMVIEFSEPIDAKLTLQFKENLEDDVFYYLPSVNLQEQRQTIDLDKIWKGLKNDTVDEIKGKWGGKGNKVSSLVLIFNNPNADITINSIYIPYKEKPYTTTYQSFNCNGSTLKGAKINNKHQNVFTVFGCWLPSQYLWVKQYIQNKHPESILNVGIDIKTKDFHKINKPYTNITILNSILYFLIGVVIFFTFWIRNKNRHTQDEENSWYKMIAKQMLFKGVNKSITPYHLLMNYGIVLIPTLLLFALMAVFKLPDMSTFKSLPMYFVWAMLQQFVLGYILAQRTFYNRTQNKVISSILAALIFSIFHLPSVTLMLVTFVAGCFWAYLWLLFKRFIPLAISHSILALMLYYVLSDEYLYSAKVLQWFWE